MARDAINRVSASTFLGFGFGSIQAGLFLSQAAKNFDRMVVAYRQPQIISAIRKNDGYFSVNIAHNDHIEKTKIGPIEIYNVNKKLDQDEIIAAIANAREISTALSSTKDYRQNSNASIHKLLAKGLIKKIIADKPSCIIYTAENDKQAAQKLFIAILSEIPKKYHGDLENKLQILNTVIGKMSIRIRDIKIIQKQKLVTITPELEQAFLVEEFSHILIEKIKLKNFKRGIENFVEKDNLLPFEEAKLYGHNAIHAMAAYLALILGLKYIKDLNEDILELLRITFMQEVGAALIKKHSGVDTLFTPNGFKAYSENLLKRMQNTYLNDTAERVARDVTRKLTWNDRLIGAIRLCFAQGIEPKHLALGVAAALQTVGKIDDFKNYLNSIWEIEKITSADREIVLEPIQIAINQLKHWQSNSFLSLKDYSLDGNK